MFEQRFLLTCGILIVFCALGLTAPQRLMKEPVHPGQKPSPSPTVKPSPTSPKGPIGPSPGGVRAMVVNFAGTWILDMSKSQGLSPSLLRADRVALIIKQDSQEISIEQKISGEGFQAAWSRPWPASPSIKGSTYKLDGSERVVDVEPDRGKSTLKATWLGKSLDLVRKSAFKTAEGEIQYVETQTLELSEDGKVLNVKVQTESPRGTVSLSLVFNRSN